MCTRMRAGATGLSGPTPAAHSRPTTPSGFPSPCPGRWPLPTRTSALAGGRSTPTATTLSSQVAGERVGIVGLDNIHVARGLTAFGCAVSYHSRSPKLSAP